MTGDRKYIDTHSHIYDKAFAGEEEEIVRRALNAGVGIILQPDVDSTERQAMADLYRRFPDVFRNMAGLYPGSVGPDWEKEFEMVEEFAHSEGIVAIGEIGLDYHYSADTSELQKAAFKAQLELAARLGLPVNIHLREATEDFFKVLDECRGLGIRGSLHAFSGSVETFRRVQKYGEWYVGIGGVLTFRNAGVAEAIRHIPLESILLETDSPYLTPVPFRGRRNESSYIPLIAAKIAEIKQADPDEVAAVTTANAERLFNIKL